VDRHTRDPRLRPLDDASAVRLQAFDRPGRAPLSYTLHRDDANAFGLVVEQLARERSMA
jgi:hypothetical protein